MQWMLIYVLVTVVPGSITPDARELGPFPTKEACREAGNQFVGYFAKIHEDAAPKLAKGSDLLMSWHCMER